MLLETAPFHVMRVLPACQALLLECTVLTHRAFAMGHTGQDWALGGQSWTTCLGAGDNCVCARVCSTQQLVDTWCSV